MTESTHIPQEDLALFAMQALSPEEAEPVRVHIDHCAACRTQVAEFSSDLALVAITAEEQPLPKGARERFLARIAADAVSPEAAPHDATSTDDAAPIDAPRPVHPVYASIQWSAVAAMLIIAFALLLKVGALNRELREKSSQLAQQAAASSRAQQVLDILTARSAQHVVLTAANAHPQPTGRAVYLAASGGLIFQAGNLDPLPAGKTYELWVIPANGQAPIPAGLFRPDAAGSASVILPSLPTGVPAKAFGVTVERAEGSSTPTAPILLSGSAPGE